MSGAAAGEVHEASHGSWIQPWEERGELGLMLRMQKWQEEDGGAKWSLRQGGSPQSHAEQPGSRQRAPPAQAGKIHGQEERSAEHPPASPASQEQLPTGKNTGARPPYLSECRDNKNKSCAQESWRAAPAGPVPGGSRAGAGGCFGVSVPCSPQSGQAQLPWRERCLCCSMRGGPWSKGAFISPGDGSCSAVPEHPCGSGL